MKIPTLRSTVLSAIILVGYFHAQTAGACQVEAENKRNAKIFYALNDKLTKYNIGAYELKNCAQDVVLSKTVELPSPQNFSTESWMTQTATTKRSCQIESLNSDPSAAITASNQSHDKFTDPSSQTASLVALADSCIGMSVQETSEKPINVDSSLNCQVVLKKSNSNLLLKGENCRVSGQGLLSLKVEWVVLNSCKSSANLTDLNLRLRTSSIARDKKNTAPPELILDKKLEFVFENGTSEDPRYKLGDQLYSVRKSGKYEFDFDFLNLSLVGSKHTQLRVKSEYMVKNFSKQKSPFVLNHSLYLVKNGNYATPVILRSWYSGANIPASWMGVDGLSETFNFGPAFDSFVLNENATKIEVGDILVLKTELLSPNRGPQRFVDFFTEQLKKYRKANPVPTNLAKNDDKIDELKPLAGISDIKVLPELDQAWADPKTTAFAMIPLSPVNYRAYCLNGECRNFDEIDEMPEIRVSFVVEEAEIGTKIKPIQIYKRNFKNQINKSDLSEMSRIKCF
tara:strand:+ start:1796 stop:3331 length:1536 start_codon:yes stop_codon:yes gene_type:complete